MFNNPLRGGRSSTGTMVQSLPPGAQAMSTWNSETIVSQEQMLHDVSTNSDGTIPVVGPEMATPVTHRSSPSQATHMAGNTGQTQGSMHGSPNHGTVSPHRPANLFQSHAVQMPGDTFSMSPHAWSFNLHSHRLRHLSAVHPIHIQICFKEIASTRCMGKIPIGFIHKDNA